MRWWTNPPYDDAPAAVSASSSRTRAASSRLRKNTDTAVNAAASTTNGTAASRLRNTAGMPASAHATPVKMPWWRMESQRSCAFSNSRWRCSTSAKAPVSPADMPISQRDPLQHGAGQDEPVGRGPQGRLWQPGEPVDERCSSAGASASMAVKRSRRRASAERETERCQQVEPAVGRLVARRQVLPRLGVEDPVAEAPSGAEHGDAAPVPAEQLEVGPRTGTGRARRAARSSRPPAPAGRPRRRP